MSGFLQLLENAPEFRETVSAVAAAKGPVGLLGLSGSSKAHLFFALCAKLSRGALLVLPDEAAAQQFAADFNEFAGNGKKALFYPARDYSFSLSQGQSREFEHKRLAVLGKILEGDYAAVVTTAEAAAQFTMPPQELKKRTLTVRPGDTLSVEELTETLLTAGFVRAETVEGSGQFAVRGGIVDFFPINAPAPVRLEFWGDTVDTLAVFDPDTQRRTDRADCCTVSPAAEVLFDSTEALADAVRKLAETVSGKGSKKAKEVFAHDLDYLDSGIRPSSCDKYLPVAYGERVTLLDYCPNDLLCICESADVRRAFERTQKQFTLELKAMFENGVLAKGLDAYGLTEPEWLLQYEKRNAIYADVFARGSFDTPVSALVNFTVRRTARWDGTLAHLLEDLRPALSHGTRCVVKAGTEKAAASLAEALETEDVNAIYLSVPPAEFPAKTVTVLPGVLSGGFALPGEDFLLISYGGAGAEPARKRRKGYRAADAVQSLDELHRGDTVVHVVHGIGVFEGIRQLDVSGLRKDYITIRYAGGDTLYVPVTQLDLVSKYIGPHEDGREVRLSKLGGDAWNRTKARVKASAKSIARDLIALYAKRQSTPGFAFSPDIDMQNDFERRFEFDETEDQLKTAAEIKHDMEQPHPMDRLLCGDVGFGKTEVALRAAFKCVADGKQCAILVPTTILALQHYNTITRRFEGFPVETEMLSRFRSAKEQTAILKKLRRGEIDIIVGTHRLISKDVQFRDLGLIIVDEEQRFGVGQKEKLKELYPDVDCLTLSATPIPRTMNMAMSGIRDMSVIEEAPQDRFPVQTYVLEHDWGIIAEAVSKELRRGGQVYYLNNVIESIPATVSKLQESVPGAVIGIGHGKMSEDKLSDVWRQLLEGEINVLVCTTIIETGVDVPNANTLIIENADRMGLAQLHQIRGRVGRSSRRGFAYFTFARDKALSEIAQKRLEAIREYTEFGSGFKIAMRDLEIRGAGNLLGSEQHGHMESVGYELYMKLLAEAVSEEKGEAPPEPPKECLVDIRVDAFIPESYIPSLPHRLGIYKRIADVRTEEDALDVTDELIDRFGEPPKPVTGLIRVALARSAAAAADIYEIRQNESNILLFSNAIDMDKVSRLAEQLRGRIMVSAGQQTYITVKRAPGQSPVDTIEEALKILRNTPKKEEDTP